jgi:hypothetical protein
MWRTPYGERILEGAEAKVFAEALLNLLKIAELNQLYDYHLGIDCFDSLTYRQKISALETTGKGLLRKDRPSIDLKGVLEGAISAVFEHLNNLIALEINEAEAGTYWREMVAAAVEETGGENMLVPTCNDLDEWIIEVESIVENILCDVDYYNYYLFIDDHSKNSIYPRKKSKLLNNYHIIPDELTKVETEAKFAELTNLCLLVTNVL